MATQVYEQTLDLVTSLVETSPLRPSDPEGLPYPSLPLVLSGKEETISFDLLTLENPLLQVLVAPQLGGRILAIRDKRTRLDIWPRPTALTLRGGGPRGVDLPLGIEWWAGTELRHNATGPIDLRVQEPGEEDAPGGFIAFELLPGTPLSWHGSVALLADRAELVVEMKLFNRSLLPQAGDAGLRITTGPGDLAWYGDDLAFYSVANDSGFLVRDARQTWGKVLFDGECLTLGVSALRQPVLAPRQTVAFRTAFIPLSGLGGLDGASPGAALTCREGKLKVQVPATLLDHKFFLLTADGQTLESPATIYAEAGLAMDLSGLPSPATQLVLRDPGKNEVVSWRAGALPTSVVARPQDGLANFSDVAAALIQPEPGTQEAAFREDFERGGGIWTQYLNHPVLRSAAAIAQSRGLGKEAAHQALEQALTFNGDDPLAWFEKALLGDAEAPEILNAHYLAPMEPLLRMHSFLVQGPTGEKEPNPLLRPLATQPDWGIEAVCFLISAGRVQDAVRVCDELLRHRPQPIIRYLLAWCYLRQSRMEATAAENVIAARALPVEPPFPWRPEELIALRELHVRFSDDAKLAEWVQLVAAFRP